MRVLQTYSDAQNIELLSGERCREWLDDRTKRAQWQALYEACPWGTAFQSPGFFDVWTRCYEADWTPLLLVARAGTDGLSALMPLAVRDDVITGVGAHQAEYHGWIASAAHLGFPDRALALLRRKFPRARIALHYLPPRLPGAVVETLAASDPRVTVRSHTCAYLDLDTAAIDEVLKKKGNKSKLNRLKREGELSVRELSAEELCAHIDRIAECCDFRQGAVNDSCPFTDDLKKREFHLRWMAACPEQLHVTGMFLGAELISTVILVQSPAGAHVAILAYAPEHAAHSANKLHFYMAARALAGRGKAEIDMTPGGAWKERFGTRFETVAEMVVYGSSLEARRHQWMDLLRQVVRQTAVRFGVPADRLRELKGALTPRASVSKLRSRSLPLLVFCRDDPAADVAGHCEAEVKTNALSDIVRWASTRRRGVRGPILRETLDRMERGERCRSLLDASGDLHALWLSSDQHEIGPPLSDVRSPLPHPGTVLSAFFDQPIAASDDDCRLLGSVARELADARPAQPVFIALEGSDSAQRAVLKRAGFHEIRSG